MVATHKQKVPVYVVKHLVSMNMKKLGCFITKTMMAFSNISSIHMVVRFAKTSKRVYCDYI